MDNRMNFNLETTKFSIENALLFVCCGLKNIFKRAIVLMFSFSWEKIKLIRMKQRRILVTFFLFVKIILFLQCSSTESLFKDDFKTVNTYDPKIANELVIISAITYESEKEIIKNKLKEAKFEFFKDSALDVELIQDVTTDTQAMIIHSKDFIIFSFRGSESSIDWLTNSDFYEKCGGVHFGFNRAYYSIHSKILNVWSAVIAVKYKNSEKIPRYYTGHSLGAALATISVLNLENSELKQLGFNSNQSFKGLYTYGSPRVFDKCLASKFDALFQDKSFRIVNNNDIVAKIPLVMNGYNHVGRQIYIDRNGDFKTDENFTSRFIDQIKGGTKSLFGIKNDLSDDHKKEKYKELLKKEQNPFPIKK